MTFKEATANHDAAKARYSALTSQTIRNEAAIAQALREHRATRYDLERFQMATMAEGFRWNR